LSNASPFYLSSLGENTHNPTPHSLELWSEVVLIVNKSDPIKFREIKQTKPNEPYQTKITRIWSGSKFPLFGNRHVQNLAYKYKSTSQIAPSSLPLMQGWGGKRGYLPLIFPLLLRLAFAFPGIFVGTHDFVVVCFMWVKLAVQVVFLLF
jgi:hypothetical protein